MASLCICADWPEHPLLNNAIGIKIACTCSQMDDVFVAMIVTFMCFSNVLYGFKGYPYSVRDSIMYS